MKDILAFLMDCLEVGADIFVILFAVVMNIIVWGGMIGALIYGLYNGYKEIRRRLNEG